MTYFYIILLISWTLTGWITSRIALQSNRSQMKWFYVGFFLGIFAILLILILNYFDGVYSSKEKVEVAPSPIDPELIELREKHWYFLDNASNQYGPMTFDAIRKSFQDGKVEESNYIWHEDLSEWQRLKEYCHFKMFTN